MFEKMPILSSNEKKKALIAHKEELLNKIKYYENRIENFRGKPASSYFEDSSDSEDDYPITIDNSSSVNQLKAEKSKFSTCLQATQELTSLEVLQSEVNIMVEDPVIESELPVREPGSWREVTAKCCIDLVQFSIMFYVHQPNRMFGPLSYRGLKVSPAKSSHDAELSKSVLQGVMRPSDAIEVLRSYAVAFRSRRTTLAKLASKYAQNLFMEPLAEGGYIMKCANLLEISWRLENKWSSVAPFHHRMKFELEYMDESYIKIITQAHKQLSDPSITTDERTLLLSKIICTCLEAKGPTQELYESMESDPESVKMLEKRRTTLDQEVEAPIAKKRKANADKNSEKESDDQIMAPPKSLPKKVKPKGKENTEQNRKSVKRSHIGEASGDVKKAKTDTDNLNNLRQSGNDQNEAEGKMNPKNNRVNVEDSDKNKAKASTSQKNTKKDAANDSEPAENVKKSKVNENPTNKAVNEGKSKSQTEKSNVNSVENVDKPRGSTKKVTTTTTDSQKASNKDKVMSATKNDPKTKVPEAGKVNDKDKNKTNAKNDPKTMTKNITNAKSITKNVTHTKNDPKSIEGNTKTNNVKPKTDITEKQAPIENAIKKKPGTSKNTDKKTTNDNKKENTKNLKTVNKPAKDKKKISEEMNENTENPNKPESETESVNNKKKSGNINKAPNDQDTKKDAISKEKTKIAKPSNTDAKTIKDKNDPQIGVNNKPAIKNVKNTEMKTSESQKPKNANPKTTENNEVSAQNLKEITTEKKITEKDKKQSKGGAIEKVSNTKSVAAKSNHIANRVNTNVAPTKKLITKTDGAKPKTTQTKMIIRNLSHKNPSAQNRPSKSKKSITSNISNIKAGNTAKMFAGKENSSATKTKIPRNLSLISEANTFKRSNPLRISPRKIPSTFKSSSDSNFKHKIAQKYVTNIPRLMKKTASK